MRTIFAIIGALAIVIYATLYFASATVDEHKGVTPKMSIKEFFNGKLEGWGAMHNWRGKLIHSFKVDINCEWQDDTGTMEEHYTFDDGSKLRRLWTIEIQDDKNFTLKTPVIVGVGTGRQEGNSAHSTYAMMMELGEYDMSVNVDDWMMMVDENMMLKKRKMRKLGITVARGMMAIQKPQPCAGIAQQKSASVETPSVTVEGQQQSGTPQNNTEEMNILNPSA